MKEKIDKDKSTEVKQPQCGTSQCSEKTQMEGDRK